MKNGKNLLLMILIFFQIPMVFGADIETYFFPDAVFKVYEEGRFLPGPESELYHEKVENFPVYINFNEAHSDKELITYSKFVDAFHKILNAEPTYFDLIAKKPERIQIDIYQHPDRKVYREAESMELMKSLSPLKRSVNDAYLEITKRWEQTKNKSIDNFRTLLADEVFSILNEYNEKQGKLPSLGSPEIYHALGKACILFALENILKPDKEFSVEQVISEFNFSRLKEINKSVSERQNRNIIEVGKIVGVLKQARPLFDSLENLELKLTYRIKEYPMYLSVYRGGCVGDCSSKSSRFFNLMPNEFTFYVEKLEGNQTRFVGYITATIVVADGISTLLIKDIAKTNNGGHYFVKEVLESFVRLKNYYGVEQIALMNENFTSNNHSGVQRRALEDYISEYKKKKANTVEFGDEKIREALDPSNKYDLPTYHQGINIIDEIKLLQVPVVSELRHKKLSSNSRGGIKRSSLDQKFTIDELESFLRGEEVSGFSKEKSLQDFLHEIDYMVATEEPTLSKIVSLLKKHKVIDLKLGQIKDLYNFPYLLKRAGVFDTEELWQAFTYLSVASHKDPKRIINYVKILGFIDKYFFQDRVLASKIVSFAPTLTETSRNLLIDKLPMLFKSYTSLDLDADEKTNVLKFLDSIYLDSKLVFSSIVKEHIKDGEIARRSVDSIYLKLKKKVFPKVVSYFKDPEIKEQLKFRYLNWGHNSIQQMFYVDHLLKEIVSFKNTEKYLVDLWMFLGEARAGDFAARKFFDVLEYLRGSFPTHYFLSFKDALKTADPEYYEKNISFIESIFTMDANKEEALRRQKRIMKLVTLGSYSGLLLTNSEVLSLMTGHRLIDHIDSYLVAMKLLSERAEKEIYFSNEELELLYKKINENDLFWNRDDKLQRYYEKLKLVNERHNEKDEVNTALSCKKAI